MHLQFDLGAWEGGTWCSTGS